MALIGAGGTIAVCFAKMASCSLSCSISSLDSLVSSLIFEIRFITDSANIAKFFPVVSFVLLAIFLKLFNLLNIIFL